MISKDNINVVCEINLSLSKNKMMPKHETYNTCGYLEEIYFPVASIDIVSFLVPAIQVRDKTFKSMMVSCTETTINTTLYIFYI